MSAATTPTNTQKVAQNPSTIDFLTSQLKTGGLVGDGASALKLMNFWTESTSGATTEWSQKMTDMGGTIKSYLGMLSFPASVQSVKKSFQGLEKRTAESFANFTVDVCAAAKSVADGVDLLGKRCGLLSKETVSLFAPIAPSAAFTFGTREVVFKNAPGIQKNWETKPKEAYSNMIKMVKHVSLAVVGALGLVANCFRSIAAPWVIPSLLTAFLVSSVSSRFFDGLVLPSNKPSVI